MSYELDRTVKRKCPCGKGFVIEKNFSNDWFQYRTDYSIDCFDCGGKYHVEEVGYLKPDGEYRSTPYIVPNGETLSYDSGRTYNVKETPFHVQLSMFNSKADLERSYKVLKDSKYYSRLEDSVAIRVCEQAKKAMNTVKIKTVLPYVVEAIERYDEVENNYERNEERVASEKKRVLKTKERSICLYNLDEV